MRELVRALIYLVVAAAVGVTAAGCGGDSAPPFSLLPITSDTEESAVPTTAVATTAVATTAVATTAVATTAVTATSPSSTTSTTVVPPAAWVPATANLVGLPSECGNMSFLAARPDRDMLIAGIALRGLFASVDGSETWASLGQGRGSDTIRNRMSSVVFDPEHPDTFWESGIYKDGGVYRTDDNGETFEQLGNVEHSDLVSVDLTDPDRRTLLSGTHEQPIVYRSGDGGDTWRDVSGTLPDGVGFASAPHVVDAQTHLLGTNNGPAAGVFRTTDAGATWSLVRPGGVVGAPLVVGGTISWLMELGGGVISSTDGGATWIETPASGEIYKYAASLIGLPDGRLATIGQDHVIVSGDGGATWSPVGSPLPYTPNGLTYSPFRDAFYVWRFACDFTTDNPIAPDAIMRLDGAVAG